MLFGMYAPVPHVTVGSKEITRSVKGALGPLPAGEIDPAFTLAKDVLCAADESGFDLCLYAERHLGADFEAWILAAAISSWTKNLRAMPAVHPGLWHPTLIAKMAACLDRLTTGRSAINLVTGWNEVEARMYGGDILLHEHDRYIRAEEFLQRAARHVERDAVLLRRAVLPGEGVAAPVQARDRAAEIFTASRSERGLEMVAKYADWWFLDYDKSAADLAGVEDSLRRAMDGMNRRAAKYGRKVRFAFNPFVAFGDTDEAALEHAKKLLTPDEPDADVRKMMSARRPGDEVGLHRPAAEGARPADEIHRHGRRAVPVEIRADGRCGARNPRRDHRAAARL